MESNLMKPRFKVIADYPGNELRVGSTLTLVDGMWCGDDYEFSAPISYFKEYPHLYKPMEWYEERKVEEMPEYVVAGTQLGRQFFKVLRYDETGFFYNENGERYLSFGYTQPSTETEYTTYINQKQIQ